MVEYSDNVGIAFLVVCGAGLSTAIGASVVFFPSLIQYANRKTLASGLGLSAGVMTYVSFVEIFGKSVQSFMDADFLENQAYLSATLCFFAGIILMICLNLVIHGVASHNLITKGQYGETEACESEHVADDQSEFVDEASLASGNSKKPNKPQTLKEKEEPHSDHLDSAVPAVGTCCGGPDPVGHLNQLREMAHKVEEREQAPAESEFLSTTEVTNSKTEVDPEKGEQPKKKKKKRKGKKEPSEEDKHKLNMMSLNTAVAIALHNFPEGLATFVATLQDPAVGAVLAIAIAIHNIPEGLCVAMPVYYATGNRWRAFSWGLISGLSEPLAALLGWLVLASWMGHMAYAVLFGIVAGMMVVISVKELVPTAHRYDPDDSVVTNMFILGMAIMAASLVLFQHL